MVPFGLHGERERSFARMSVLVNAYEEESEEVTAFGKPVHYLSHDEALARAATAMGVDRAELKDAKATLMFKPSKVSHIRDFPFWEIVVKGRTLISTRLEKFSGDWNSAFREIDGCRPAALSQLWPCLNGLA